MDDMGVMTVALGLCGLLMIGIGISNIISRKSVGFYSGERGPVFENPDDMKAWNTRHGAMWIIYGIIIIASFFGGSLLENWITRMVVILAGLLGPIPVMITIHHLLLKKCMKK